MAKEFTLAYVTTHPRMGTKLRFGNVDRTAILVKEGHDPIRYVKVSETPVDKRQLAELAAAHPEFQDEWAQTAIQLFLVKPAKVKQDKESTEATEAVEATETSETTETSEVSELAELA